MANVIQIVGARHTLTICDYTAPLAPQFEHVEAVIDYGGSMGTPEMADLSSSVRLWHMLSNGYDHFDLDYWGRRRIPVSNCPGECSGIPLAECVMMFMLMLARRWNVTQSSVHSGKFCIPMGYELENRNLLLIGFGASGRQLASRASAFGMKVSAVDVRDISSEEVQRYGLVFAGTPKDIDTVMRESDYVSLHLPLKPETRKIINEQRLALMKPSAYLINVARGALVDEAALYKVLCDRRIAGAALDVFDPEPINPNHPILQLPNVLATPHISGDTDGTWYRRVVCAAQNLDRIALGLEPLHRVDADTCQQAVPVSSQPEMRRA